ncbi:unnamed protein product, partial [Mycena citricolor]
KNCDRWRSWDENAGRARCFATGDMHIAQPGTAVGAELLVSPTVVRLFGHRGTSRCILILPGDPTGVRCGARKIRCRASSGLCPKERPIAPHPIRTNSTGVSASG